MKGVIERMMLYIPKEVSVLVEKIAYIVAITKITISKIETNKEV